MNDAIETLAAQVKSMSESLDGVIDEMGESGTLANTICSLTQKLDGVGIEIYHLNSAITSLKCVLERMREDRE